MEEEDDNRVGWIILALNHEDDGVMAGILSQPQASVDTTGHLGCLMGSFSYLYLLSFHILS
jgi:hypothetical protein